MNYTTNYQLNKPERNEQFNIDHWNNNSDAIDRQMHINAVNIATNANNISTLLANLTTNNAIDTSSTYFKLMKLIYPIGSIYWSGNSTNPATLFGGTWTQIKDKFIWAKGDNDTLNTTGGAKTVTLAVANLPSHNHSFTPQGTINITTNPTFTGIAVTSGANNRGHTHSVTANGTVSSHTHTLNDGNTSSSGTTTTAGIRHSGNTGGMSANETHTHTFNLAKSNWGGTSINNCYIDSSQKSTSDLDNKSSPSINSASVAHTHSLPASYIYGKTDSTQPTFTGIAVTSGGESQNHTHSVTASGSISGGTYSFSGTTGTTGNTGIGDAVDKMPPYIVKYCWERTA